MSEITKAELEAAVVGNMVHVETVANASKPEPDVLKRLKQIQPQKNYVGIDMRQLLADAIAEIKTTRNLLKLSLDALKLHQLEFEIRREGTEAEPVAYGVFSDGKLHDMVHDSRFEADLWMLSQYGEDTPGVFVRALAVVVPKGDTEE